MHKERAIYPRAMRDQKAIHAQVSKRIEQIHSKAMQDKKATHARVSKRIKWWYDAGIMKAKEKSKASHAAVVKKLTADHAAA